MRGRMAGNTRLPARGRDFPHSVVMICVSSGPLRNDGRVEIFPSTGALIWAVQAPSVVQGGRLVAWR